MRLTEVTVRDVRSIRGEPVTVPLARGVTALVGPNGAGKSNLVHALAMALDPHVGFDPARDRPVGEPRVVPEVTCRFAGRHQGADTATELTVTWALGDRAERVDPTGPASATLPHGPGSVVIARADDTAGAIVSRAAGRLHLDDPERVREVEDALRHAMAQVIPEVDRVALAPDGLRTGVRVVDRDGFEMSHGTGLRACAAVGVAHHLASRGEAIAAVIVEEPEAFLHPAAQEAMRDELDRLAVTADAAILVTSESPFVISRSPEAAVIAVARDRSGRTTVVGVARGDEPQAPLLGGLFRDPGFAAVLDRTTRFAEGVAGVVVFEGGTDEAYLRIAAEVLGRADELAHLAIQPAGGAMAAALQAIVLRAETETPILVVLDNDDPGQRAKQTLVSRFGFTNRRQVTTYAEVVPDYPDGTEAEDVFDWHLVERFVAEQGDAAIRGKHILRVDEWHFDLTSAAKSAFVGWLRHHAEPTHLERWGQLLDLISERLPGPRP